MLKNVTLGQYFPGSSIIHRLDPRTKLILTLVYIVVLFLCTGPSGYAICLIALCVCIGISQIKPKLILRGMKPLIIVIVITGLLNIFYTRGETVLLSFWVLTVTAEGIRNAVFMTLRILMLVSGTFLMTYTTSPLALTDAMESLMNPLKKLKMPVHELSMMMSIALRFIPTLIEETDKIMSAQKARGADFESGNLLQKAKALLPLLIPLFISAFRRADELAVAMEARGYHGGEGRTKMKQLRYMSCDAAAFTAGAVFAAAVIITRFLPV
ncbi:MAG: energy-coupling factor transporter transmembrane protein EcfT [Oscillospiraceae bacterium]|jgi:energy-coupling factor transport system permease protein|nr:energy-coupling factor transporter transmembrane protein EcfT [Oscillospiraceae bacterium]